jgi:hypothetical protein
MKYHHFHRFFANSVVRGLFGVKIWGSGSDRLVLKTVSVGEFDWGGTSVKR